MKKLTAALLMVLIGTTAAMAKDNYNLQGPVYTSPSASVQYSSKVNSSKNCDTITIPSRASLLGPASAMPLLAAAHGDPYVIKIDNIKYYLVFNSKNNVYTAKNIVGYTDTQANLFDSMLALNSDKDDTKITPQELKKAGVRLVALQSNGKLAVYDKSQDYNLKNIAYIDLRYIRQTLNAGTVGTFGYFDVYLKDKNKQLKKVIGQVTFEKEQALNNLL